MIGRGGILSACSISCGVEREALGRTASCDVFSARILSEKPPDPPMIFTFEKTKAQKSLCHEPM